MVRPASSFAKRSVASGANDDLSLLRAVCHEGPPIRGAKIKINAIGQASGSGASLRRSGRTIRVLQVRLAARLFARVIEDNRLTSVRAKAAIGVRARIKAAAVRGAILHETPNTVDAIIEPCAIRVLA